MLKNKTSVSNGWPGEYLCMGADAAISRNVSHFKKENGEKSKLYRTMFIEISKRKA